MDTLEQIQFEKLQQELQQTKLQLADVQSKFESSQKEIAVEKQHMERLLLNILPEEIYRELLKDHTVVPQYYKSVSVLFLDFVGFTSMCEHIELRELISELNTHFTHFDDICERHFLEKIKTIGDAYMCAGGLPMRNHSHPIDIVWAAMEMMQYIENVNVEKRLAGKDLWNIRIGINTGSVIAGVVGRKKFLYDIWGDTVNVASRMETGSNPGKINISGKTYEFVKKFFSCSYRGAIPVKHKDDIEMYYVDGFLPKYSLDTSGILPNNDFYVELGKI